MDLKKIGEKIQMLRIKAGHNQDDFAEMVGVGYRTLQRIEAGESSPDIVTLEEISKALRVNIDEFIHNDADFLKVKESQIESTKKEGVATSPLDLSSIDFSGRLLCALAKLQPFHRDFVLALALKDFSFLEKYEDSEIDEVFQEILKYS